jgi:formate C-acetyltransferase
MIEQWEGFKSGKWCDEINVRDFIQNNFTEYTGDEKFLADPTEATIKLNDQVKELELEEVKRGGVYNADTSIISTITSHDAGYLNKDLEKIVGIQTDKPFKRSLQPFGGIRMSEKALSEYGYEIDPDVRDIFTKYRKTHNEGVFDVYTDEMKAARHAAIITGLPDAYGRGRIIGDYRRIALYGVDKLIEYKQAFLKELKDEMTDDVLRTREETSEQIKALKALKVMASKYGFDISAPAKNANEAVQFLYFGYLAAVKDQNGAAMSIGRNTTFLDIYIERDIKNGTLTTTPA